MALQIDPNPYPDPTHPEQRAAHLLVHYFRTVFEAAGLPWEPDNESEVIAIVEAIMEAVVMASKAIAIVETISKAPTTRRPGRGGV